MRRLRTILAIALCVFVLAEANYAHLGPQAQLAIFAMLGLLALFLTRPAFARPRLRLLSNGIDALLCIAVIVSFGYVAVQTEPFLARFWVNGDTLGNRAGAEQTIDFVMGWIGVLVILEATRRAIGWTLPVMTIVFLLYAHFGAVLPDWMLPHRGYGWDRITSAVFLQSQGVFSTALNVMFKYVFLFVLFGTLLEQTGATAFIINLARRLFRRSPGGAAKVAVLSSGMLGSLSGSAVANTATTGTFTIPMMRAAGFSPAVAAGIEAAASSGGALMPPIMGAGAYMMLELLGQMDASITYLSIIRAALVPAILYYVALLLLVHLQAKRVGAMGECETETAALPLNPWSGVVFLASFTALIALLVLKYTPFRAVSLSMVVIAVASMFNPASRLNGRRLLDAVCAAARGSIVLVAAAACVGIILGVVTLTGVGTALPGAILPLAQNNLFLALVAIMVSTIVLGMGLPSAVCYLLMATLIGPVLGDLGIPLLAAHLFIFYFGMMSMVTPPVALAAYTAAAIAEADIMKAGFAAFRFALIGFALPFAFVLRPELLLLSDDGGPASVWPAVANIAVVLLGIVALASATAGYGQRRLTPAARFALFVVAAFLILARTTGMVGLLQVAVILAVLAAGRHSGPIRGPGPTAA